ncbi:beta-ketoacyl synthase N-terminal-like domain-containing protein [Robiginitalea sp. IMCC43444]|uniref:beta-ketoacyl synthase N-terminal-like domain-containing protein n=1 Tax=Robiginitalea sp. IMCC43444 TaxID=3459121 RepID=UPI0040411B32
MKISIRSLYSISALGDSAGILEAYANPSHFLRKVKNGDSEVWVGRIPQNLRSSVLGLRNQNPNYARLDETVLFAIWAARKAMEQAAWTKGKNTGINIGSSRGATNLFEKYHSEYLRSGSSSTLASPSTTLGNIASWVAQDLQTSGPDISHSITCSTALHAVLNAVAWLESGMADKFVVGGSEAALTDFTLAQIRALKIYSPLGEPYPCRALDPNKTTNTMVLGEGAAIACLEAGLSEDALAYICGIGYATEILSHPASLSAEGNCLGRSMEMAIGDVPKEAIDVVVMHAPGTLKGDQSEFQAIKGVFGSQLPTLTGNKWKIGHTFGASGMLSLEMAVCMLREQQIFGTPFTTAAKPLEKLNYILVNAVGFGGNAVSVLLSKS